MGQNKTGKYLKYAIGEIILVMVGILLALQVNNWNEEHKIELRKIEYMKSLVLDLKKDSIRLNECINFDSIKTVSLAKILVAFKNKTKFKASPRELYNYTSVTKSLIIHNATYKSMTSENGIELLDNVKIENAISSYYSSAEHIIRFETWYAEFSLAPLLQIMYKNGVGMNLIGTNDKMEDEYEINFDSLSKYQKELKGYLTEAQIMTKDEFLSMKELNIELTGLLELLGKELLY